MSELEVVSNTSFPRTRQTIADDLRQLGLTSGAIALVHSSLSSLGWVCGGAVAFVQALMDVVTEARILVMPTHSGDYSDPAQWQNPPVPSQWQPTKRVWKNYEDLDFNSDCFDRLGQEFERQGDVKVANVESASTRLFSIKSAVNFAVNWFEKA